MPDYCGTKGCCDDCSVLLLRKSELDIRVMVRCGTLRIARQTEKLLYEERALYRHELLYEGRALYRHAQMHERHRAARSSA